MIHLVSAIASAITNLVGSRNTTRVITAVYVLGVLPALTVAAAEPDVQIGTRRNFREAHLDYYRTNGNLVAVLQSIDGISVNQSSDGGDSWTEAIFVDDYSYPYDTSIATLGDYLFVAVADTNDSGVSQLWVGAHPLSGSVVYQLIAEDAVNTFKEVALVSNVDDANTMLHLLAIDSAQNLRWFKSSQLGVWTEISTGVDYALQGLDAAWNDDFSTYKLFASFYGDASHDYLYILRWYPGSIEVQQKVAAPGDVRTSISAYADNVLCAFKVSGGVKGFMSRDGGDSWNWSWIAEDSGFYEISMVAVTGVGSDGFAAIYSDTSSTLGYRDDFFRHRGYEVGELWSDPLRIHASASSSSIGDPVTVEHLPPGQSGLFGSIMVDTYAYFTKPLCVFADSFESGDVTLWSASIP